MSVNTEPMNLKDAFAYMNFLSTSMQTARDLLSPVSPRLDVRTISSDNYLYTSRKVLRYSEVNSGMEDTQEDVEDLRSYSVTATSLSSSWTRRAGSAKDVLLRSRRRSRSSRATSTLR